MAKNSKNTNHHKTLPSIRDVARFINEVKPAIITIISFGVLIINAVFYYKLQPVFKSIGELAQRVEAIEQQSDKNRDSIIEVGQKLDYHIEKLNEKLDKIIFWVAGR